MDMRADEATDEAARCALTAAGMVLGLVAIWAVLVPFIA